jgi:hypothetical protein
VQGASIVERPLGAVDMALSASCSLAIWTEAALQVRCTLHQDTVGRHVVSELLTAGLRSQQPVLVPQLSILRDRSVLLQGDTMEDVILDVLGPALYTLSFAFSSLLLIVEAAAPFQVVVWLAIFLSLC